MVKVFISIITFNGTESTLQCLQSLQKVLTRGIELTVLVVDNASSQPFIINKKFTNFSLQIMRNSENSGFSGGHNIAIRQAMDQGADYIIVLNNDTILDKSCIQELLQIAETSESFGLVCPKIYFSPGSEFHKDRYEKSEQGKVIWYAGGSMDWNNVIGKHRGVDEVDIGQYDNAEKTDFGTGCCMLVKRKVFEIVGTFDEKYFLYYEDADLCERLSRHAYTIMYAPKAFLWHKNAESTGGSGSDLQDYFISRNRLLFGMRYAPLRTKIALLRESFRLLLNGRKWQKEGVKDYFSQKLGKGSFQI